MADFRTQVALSLKLKKAALPEVADPRANIRTAPPSESSAASGATLGDEYDRAVTSANRKSDGKTCIITGQKHLSTQGSHVLPVMRPLRSRQSESEESLNARKRIRGRHKADIEKILSHDLGVTKPGFTLDSGENLQTLMHDLHFPMDSYNVSCPVPTLQNIEDLIARFTLINEDHQKMVNMAGHTLSRLVNLDDLPAFTNPQFELFIFHDVFLSQAPIIACDPNLPPPPSSAESPTSSYWKPWMALDSRLVTVHHPHTRRAPLSRPADSETNPLLLVLVADNMYAYFKAHYQNPLVPEAERFCGRLSHLARLIYEIPQPESRSKRFVGVMTGDGDQNETDMTEGAAKKSKTDPDQSEEKVGGGFGGSDSTPADSRSEMREWEDEEIITDQEEEAEEEEERIYEVKAEHALREMSRGGLGHEEFRRHLFSFDDPKLPLPSTVS